MLFETIDLSKLFDTEFHEREINGKKELCLSIPLRINGIDMLPNGRCFLNCYLADRYANNRNITHLVMRRYRDKELYGKLIELGFGKNINRFGTVRSGFHEQEVKYENRGRIPLEEAMNREGDKLDNSIEK